MSTSGTYNFTSPESVELIQDAYQRIGVTDSQLSGDQILSAKRSLNFILSSWVNKGLNLWTVGQGMLGLNSNQNSYSLPLGVIDFLEATLRQSQRNIGGTAFSSAGGVAQYAFDNNPQTACTQTSANGYISYTWGSVQYPIAMVGVQSNFTRSYALELEYSNDNITWTSVKSIPAQFYSDGVIEWFVITVPTLGSYFRVRETGGAILDIQELYFNTTIEDTILTRMSRSEYVAIPNKNNQGRPTSFYVDRLISPTVKIWPTPVSPYNNIYYTYVNQIQDIGALADSAQIPARFLEALCSKLAHMLSIKKQPLDLAQVQYLGAYADAEYVIAGKEDSERVPLRLYGQYNMGGYA